MRRHLRTISLILIASVLTILVVRDRMGLSTPSFTVMPRPAMQLALAHTLRLATAPPAAFPVAASSMPQTSKDLFPVQTWAPPPPVQTPAANTIVTPVGPVFAYRVLGKQRVEGRWQVFLSAPSGEVVVVVAGARLHDGFRVDSINPPRMIISHPGLKPQILAIGDPV